MHIEQRERQGGKTERRTSTKRKIVSWLAAGAVSSCVLLPSCSGSSDTTSARSGAQLSIRHTEHNAKPNTEIPSTVGTPVHNLCNVPDLANYIRSVLHPAEGPLHCKDTSFAVYPWASGVGSWKQELGNAASSTSSTTMRVYTVIVPNDESRSSALFPVDHNVWQHDLHFASSPTKIPSLSQKIIRIFPDRQKALTFTDSFAPNEPYSSYEEGIETSYGGNYVVYIVVDSEGKPISGFPLSDEESLLRLMIEDGFTR
ncbi:hypothetical protein M1512_04665 [Patescibacteria group bacterium]|nr:hypothetical protein [Patescibacteria group bacterium]